MLAYLPDTAKQLCVTILYSDKTDRSSAKQSEPGVISDCG